MPPTQAAECEKAIQADPENFELRCKLLGYYSSNRYIDPVGVQKYHEHVVFAIKRFPESRITGSHYAHFDLAIDDRKFYDEAKKVWLSQVDSHPKNPAIIHNASKFFANSESQLAKELKERLESLPTLETDDAQPDEE